MEKNSVNVKIELSADSAVPRYLHDGDSGADICSAEDCVIPPGSIRAVSIGIKAEVPDGYELQVRPRSGLAMKHGIGVLNSPGTIDSGYRGEIKVILVNLGSETYAIKKGDRIAQLVLAPVCRANFVRVAKVLESTRGEGGFGSTGK